MVPRLTFAITCALGVTSVAAQVRHESQWALGLGVSVLGTGGTAGSGKGFGIAGSYSRMLSNKFGFEAEGRMSNSTGVESIPDCAPEAPCASQTIIPAAGGGRRSPHGLPSHATDSFFRRSRARVRTGHTGTEQQHGGGRVGRLRGVPVPCRWHRPRAGDARQQILLAARRGGLGVWDWAEFPILAVGQSVSRSVGRTKRTPPSSRMAALVP